MREELQPTDEVLMVAWCQGSESAFRRLFERYYRPLVAIMRRCIADPEDALELVQQTFLQLHRARDEFRQGEKLRPWLLTIALNLRRQHLRRMYRRPAAAELGPEDAIVAPYDPVATCRRGAVRQAVAGLPHGQREVIELHWFEGLSFAEIANRLGATPVAVRIRASRGYGRLRTSLAAV